MKIVSIDIDKLKIFECRDGFSASRASVTVDELIGAIVYEKVTKDGNGSKKSDAVNHPSHYNVGSIEVIDAVNEWGLDFDLGNVVKYVARAGHKDATKTIEDLEKAKFYLEDKIKRLRERQSDVQEGETSNEETQEAQ